MSISERTLGMITLVLGILVWLVLILGTFGGALIGLGFGFLLYLFAQSALIAHIRGNGVELSPNQYPELYAQFTACCDRLQLTVRPQAYILNGNGGLNAFATKFLGTQYVVLLSDVVDAMAQHNDGVRFYIGHELGHLRMKHLRGQLLRWPVLWLPLLGAAYSRARESTCDRHGLACCASPDGAARALAALSAGPRLWQQLNVAAYERQAQLSSGFWMSFHELTAGYPWLTKRVTRVMNTQAPSTGRHGLAYVLAVFVPYAGRMGAGFGFLMLIYIVGVLAAVAIPAYKDYTVKAHLTSAMTSSQAARDSLRDYYATNRKVADSLATAGVMPQLPDGTYLSYEPKGMILTVTTPQGELTFTPRSDAMGGTSWNCTGGEGLRASQLPQGCVGSEPPQHR